MDKLKFLRKQSNFSVMSSSHKILSIDETELDLERTLLGGQSFRWTKSIDGDDRGVTFTGVLLGNVFQFWRVSSKEIAYRQLNNNPPFDDQSSKTLLEEYFQTKYNLKQLYKEWSSNDANLAARCEEYKGFRILRQDPVENVFSFMCATNNNIKRITLMIEKMCQKFGKHIETNTEDKYFAFPEVERLAAEDVFDCLRYKLGFGYRAKFITETAKQILKVCHENGNQTPRDYLLSLRQLPYQETRKKLMQFPGIGRKVADCICLMSMDHLGSVPTDCHIHEIVCRDYLPNLKTKHKTLTDAVHDLIGSHFKQLHGPLAGWSTSVLFISELKHLKAVANKEPKQDEYQTKVKREPSVKKSKKRQRTI